MRTKSELYQGPLRPPNIAEVIMASLSDSNFESTPESVLLGPVGM
jgi:hypothetical protein